MLHETKTSIDYALLHAYETKGYIDATDEEGDPAARQRRLAARLGIEASNLQAQLLDLYHRIEKIKFPEPTKIK